MKLPFHFLAINISLLLLSTESFAQTSQQNQNTEIPPFSILIINGTYDHDAHRMVIILTDKDLKISDQYGMNQMKDSLLFSKSLSRSDTLLQISKVNFDQLKYSYINPCVTKGSRFSVDITKNGKSRRVWLGNYYVQEVGNFVSLFNMLLPEKYRIWYDKTSLEAQDCTGYEKGEAIQLFDSTSGNLLRLDSTHTIVSAIDKNGQILWKTELDSKWWADPFPFRGKNDSALTKANRMKENTWPRVTYFKLTKESEISWCRSPDGSATLGIGFERMSFIGLDVKNGKVLCAGRD